MQLICNNGVVIAWHDDSQTILPSVYGPEAILIPYKGSMSALSRIGSMPENWPANRADPRAYAQPLPTPVLLAGYAAFKRWLTSISGVAVSGVQIATDDASRGMIAEVKQNFDNGAITGTVSFKALSGWVTLTGPQITSVNQAVVAHIQACFAAEAAADAAITAGTCTTFAQVDAFFQSIA